MVVHKEEHALMRKLHDISLSDRHTGSFRLLIGLENLSGDNLGRSQAASGMSHLTSLLPTMTHKFGEGIGQEEW